MFTCIECEREINQASEICPYCGADLTAPPLASIDQALPKKAKPARVILLWAIALGIVAGIGWLAVPWRMAGSKTAAESRARQAVASVQQALASYYASEGTYPNSIEALGDVARQAAQSAQSVHYQLQYVPGQPAADGRVKSYTLQARSGNFGYTNFYTDETAILRATTDDRAASAQDPPARNP
jgi:type II secretory pathway pseudopilin PulG